MGLSYENAERQIEEIKRGIVEGMQRALSDKGYEYQEATFQFYIPDGYKGVGWVQGVFCVIASGTSTPYNALNLDVDTLMKCYRSVLHLMPREVEDE